MSDIFKQLFDILELLQLPRNLSPEMYDRIDQGSFYEASYCKGDVRLKNCEGEVYRYNALADTLELLSVCNETSSANYIHLTTATEKDKSKYSHPVKYNFCGYEVFLDFTDLGHVVHALNVIKRDSGVCIDAPVKIGEISDDINPKAY